VSEPRHHLLYELASCYIIASLTLSEFRNSLAAFIFFKL
jgi:hypothetical protein